MSTTNVTIADESCAAFRNPSLATLQPDTIHRMVVGENPGPRPLDPDEAREELGDPFAVKLLLEGTFPRTAGEVLEALADAAGPDDPLAKPQFFLVGEGSQIPVTGDTATVERNLRFLATTGSGQQGPDVLIASFHPDTNSVEVMAWDHESGGFNYYRTVGDTTAWVFAGNSRHALLEPTEFKGPFESHTSGNFLMKELRAPWLHWDSPDAPVTPDIFSEDDPLRDHPWFEDREPMGALTCETAVARPAIQRWTDARFDALLADQPIQRPQRIMQQVLTTPTVNLITSHTESRLAVDKNVVDLPPTFFVDSQTLAGTLGLQAPPAFKVSGDIYASSLETFEFRLSDGEGFERPGDTHFAFPVPERAFEDQAVIAKAIKVGLLTERFAACLLMTDFPNPVFSPRRAELMDHVPPTAVIEDGESSFSQDMSDAILAAAGSAGPESPEVEFAQRWETGDDWRDELSRLLNAYYEAVAERLQTQDGFDDYCRLAESRRHHVRRLPIFESQLLFPQTNIDGTIGRSTQSDATVAEV